MTIPDGVRVRKTQCASCVMREECEGGFPLSPERRQEVRDYLVRGTNQLCHTDDNRTICRGGRDFQLQVWSGLGFIAAPTEEALRQAMTAAGITPRGHV